MKQQILRAIPYILVLSLLISYAQAETRTWKSHDGYSVEAEILGFSDGQVSLKRKEDGIIITVPVTRLSTVDREYIAQRGSTLPPVKKSLLKRDHPTPQGNHGFALPANAQLPVSLFLGACTITLIMAHFIVLVRAFRYSAISGIGVLIFGFIGSAVFASYRKEEAGLAGTLVKWIVCVPIILGLIAAIVIPILNK